MDIEKIKETILKDRLVVKTTDANASALVENAVKAVEAPRSRHRPSSGVMAMMGLSAMGSLAYGSSVRHVQPKRLQCQYCGRLQRKDDPEAKGWQKYSPTLCDSCLKKGVLGSRIKPVVEDVPNEVKEDTDVSLLPETGVLPGGIDG